MDRNGMSGYSSSVSASTKTAIATIVLAFVCVVHGNGVGERFDDGVGGECQRFAGRGQYNGQAVGNDPVLTNVSVHHGRAKISDVNWVTSAGPG